MSNWEPVFGRVAILGLGLMGGSLGLALKASGAPGSALKGRGTSGGRPGGSGNGAWVVAGYDAAPGVAERARERGAVDVACASVAEAVADTDLVVLAAPVIDIMLMMNDIAPHLTNETVVTDLGSTKTRVLNASERDLPYPHNFVGGHPMTGSERAGIEAADAGLYRGRLWCLTRSSRTTTAALERVRALVEGVGARPIAVEAAEHDAAVAAISHLPLVAASALVLAATESPEWELARALAAGGFRDTTRIASGDPHMARDICLTNTQPLLDCLDVYLSRLRELRERVAAGDPAVEEMFAEAKSARDGWVAASRRER